MSDGVTDGIRAEERYNAWLSENAAKIEKNWKDGRIMSGIGAQHLVDEFEPELDTYIREKLIVCYMAVTGKKYSFREGPNLCFTYTVAIKVEKIEEIKYTGPIDKRRTEIPISHLKHPTGAACGVALDDNDSKGWALSIEDVTCPECKKCVPKCAECHDTGVIETGNNDLACGCEAGDTALFNIAEHPDRQVSGRHVKDYHYNDSEYECPCLRGVLGVKGPCPKEGECKSHDLDKNCPEGRWIRPDLADWEGGI